MDRWTHIFFVNGDKQFIAASEIGLTRSYLISSSRHKQKKGSNFKTPPEFVNVKLIKGVRGVKSQASRGLCGKLKGVRWWAW